MVSGVWRPHQGSGEEVSDPPPPPCHNHVGPIYYWKLWVFNLSTGSESHVCTTGSRYDGYRRQISDILQVLQWSTRFSTYRQEWIMAKVNDAGYRCSQYRQYVDNFRHNHMAYEQRHRLNAPTDEYKGYLLQTESDHSNTRPPSNITRRTYMTLNSCWLQIICTVFPQ